MVGVQSGREEEGKGPAEMAKHTGLHSVAGQHWRTERESDYSKERQRHVLFPCVCVCLGVVEGEYHWRARSQWKTRLA